MTLKCAFQLPKSKFIQRFLSDTAGAVGMYIALAAVPMLGFAGLATDVTRAYMVKSRLSSSLDAAGLAGGWSFYRDTRDADVKMFFDTNFPENYLGAVISGPEIVADSANETLTLTATATVPTLFMHFFGFNSISVNAETEVTRQMQALDVVLAIDMSGSMSSDMGAGTRISTARDAANQLLDILFGTNASKELLNVGVVPWNGKVNVMLDGTTFDNTMTLTNAVAAFTNPVNLQVQDVTYTVNNSPVPLLKSPDADWKGCVYSRFIDDDNEATNADTLYSTVGDWQAWEPVGVEGEPASSNGSSIRILQSKSSSNYDSSITVSFDGVATKGNALIALGSRRGGGDQFNTPAGWTSAVSLTANAGGIDRRTRIFYKKAEGGEKSMTFTADNTVEQAMTVIEVSGLDWNSLIDATSTTDATGATSTTVDLTSIYASNKGDLLLAVAAFEDDDLSGFSWTNSFTQLADVEQIGGDGEDLTHAVGFRVVSSKTTYSTDFVASSGEGEENWGAMIALEASSVCSSSPNNSECTPCLSHGITPLINTKATITAAINALTSPNGTTNITQGLGWAWRVLKPEAPFTEAVAAPDYKREQAIVLLTDGENYAGYGDGYKATFGSGSTGSVKMDERLRKIAANIKADGVILYVVQFANDGTALQTLLKEIASGPDSPYYHYAPDAPTLQKVFREVANHLSQLRLSK